MVTRRRKLVVALSLLLILVALWLTIGRDPLRSRARREWKNNAIQSILARTTDKPKLDQNLATLTATARAQHDLGAWVGDDLLIMRNGEWILCRNICQKSDSRIRDIFIGYGSDKRWYYSTFHFCVGKCVLQVEPQPDSLKDFINGYWLVEFDGKSDECLKQTWTDGPWGTEKTQSATTAP